MANGRDLERCQRAGCGMPPAHLVHSEPFERIIGYNSAEWEAHAFVPPEQPTGGALPLVAGAAFLSEQVGAPVEPTSERDYRIQLHVRAALSHLSKGDDYECSQHLGKALRLLRAP